VSDGGRRLFLVVVLVAVFGGIAVVDRVVGRSPESLASAPAPALATQRVAPAGVESAAWYCAGGTAPGGEADPTVLLANTGARSVSGTVTSASAGSAPSSAPVTVPARGSTEVHLTGAADVAASVVLDGGGVGAWLRVTGPAGWSVAPCASAPAGQWYFPHGSTRTGDAMALALYNPSATDAVVDITLLTSTGGVVAPAAYQGIDVAPGSVVVENVGDHVQNDPSIAAEAVAVSGTFVAFERQTTAQPGAGGLSLVQGAPGSATTWAFAQSTDRSGGSVTYTVLNPSAQSARVSVSIGLQHGSAAPLTLSVAPQSTVRLSAGDQTRIPVDTPYSLTFASGVGIVVGREVDAPAGGSAPLVGINRAVSPGATRWLVPKVPAPGTGAWYLAVANVAGRPVTLTVRSLSGSGWSTVPGVAGRVAPGQPVMIGPNPGSPIGTTVLEVTASGPVAVQLDAAPAGAPGVVVIPALALG
jgi:hypothetical protein